MTAQDAAVAASAQAPRRLRRMRAVATGLLFVMAGLCVVAIRFKSAVPALAWLEAFAEAGLVGGLADWFAVVALFRHPLGLPIPHTAIVPANKDRIGVELGRFVEHNFLTPENIVAKLEEFDLARELLRWLAEADNSGQVARTSQQLLPRLLDAIDEAYVERVLKQALRVRVENLDLARGVARIVAMGENDPYRERPAGVLGATAQALELYRSALGIKRRQRPGAITALDVGVRTGVINTLINAATTPARIRGQIDSYVGGVIRRQSVTPQNQARAFQVKRAIVQFLDEEHFVLNIWHEIKDQLAAECASEGSEFTQRFNHALASFARDAQRDAASIERLNAEIRRFIEAALGRMSSQISELIADVVRGWEGADIAAEIEREIGADLQYVRLNGTIVGASAGLLLHAALVLSGLA